MEESRAAVHRGGQFLDDYAMRDPAVVPKDWRHCINQLTLDIGNPYLCVLGQVARHNDLATDSFGDLAFVMNLGTEDCVEFGFTAPTGTAMSYKIMTRAWVEYLTLDSP
jgi:hypothetical protein